MPCTAGFSALSVILRIGSMFEKYHSLLVIQRDSTYGALGDRIIYLLPKSNSLYARTAAAYNEFNLAYDTKIAARQN
jgi:hypothetical protein